MRASALTIALLLALPAGPAEADPTHREEKPWTSAPTAQLADIPEDEIGNSVCPGQPMNCGDVITPAVLLVGDEDWTCFQANAGELITVGTDTVSGQPSVDTFLDVFSSDCTSILDSDDDGGPGLYSLLTFIAPYTGNYYPRVSGFAITSSGSYKQFVTCTVPPAGDTCMDPLAIVSCSAGTLNGNSSSFSNAYDPGAGSCTGFSAAGRDIVYAVNLDVGDIVDLTYTQFNADASFYVVTDCTDLLGTCVSGADATFNGQAETIQFTAAQQATHYVILDTFGTNAGADWELVYDIDCGAIATEPVSWTRVKAGYR